jgi:CheY-like chemotaxis protein
MIETSHKPACPSDSRIFFLTASQLLPSGEPSNGSEFASSQPEIRDQAKRRWALVVDDVSDVTEMLSVLMNHAGYEVSTASGAQEAITLARENHFDIVISDIGMPEMNGYELAQALRKLPGYESVPMVAVTGFSLFDDRNRSLTAGFNEHVTKPIDPAAFLALIEQL